MQNRFPTTPDNKRYHTWNHYLRRTFGRKVMKISLNAGFICPNIDGSKGVGGCTYCADGSGEFAGRPSQPVVEQLAAGRELLHGRWPDAGYLAYFQAHTNTYGPVEQLRQAFEPVLGEPGVVGIAVATRADCLAPEVVDYLADLGQRTWLVVELGLQSVYDSTAKAIHRCHDYAAFLDGYHRLRQAGVAVCIHLINGLPGEDHAMMVESARQVGLQRPHSVKIHMLHILQGTPIARHYQQGTLPLLTREEYVATVCDQLEQLPPDTVIQRLTGDGKADDLLAPLWTRNKIAVLNEIDKELRRRDSWQGRLFSPGE